MRAWLVAMDFGFLWISLGWPHIGFTNKVVAPNHHHLTYNCDGWSFKGALPPPPSYSKFMCRDSDCEDQPKVVHMASAAEYARHGHFWYPFVLSKHPSPSPKHHSLRPPFDRLRVSWFVCLIFREGGKVVCACGVVISMSFYDTERTTVM